MSGYKDVSVSLIIMDVLSEMWLLSSDRVCWGPDMPLLIMQWTYVSRRFVVMCRQAGKQAGSCLNGCIRCGMGVYWHGPPGTCTV
jgi:hypothetical protein